jgi:hypothetical protein
MSVPRALLRLSAVLLLFFFLREARGAQIPSAWRKGDVRIDGVADEWAGRLIPLAGLPIDLGVQNDGSFLYVCVQTKDEATKKQILAVGLSLYLDASGKEDRTFGVRFPVGRIGTEDADVPDTGDAQFTRALDLSVAGGELVVLGRQDVGRMRVAEALPLQVALGEDAGVLVLEFRVPLAFSVETPHAIETKPGQTIALGIETTPPKAKKQRVDESSSGFSRGGRRGSGGFGRGRGGRSPGEKSMARSFGKALKSWLKVSLATEVLDER